MDELPSPMPDVVIGIHDAMTTLIGVLLALGIEPSVLAAPFQFQRDAHRHAGRPDAAGFLDSLLDFVIDPELQQKRETIQLLHSAPPKGTA